MRIEGTYQIPATRGSIYQHLLDPAILGKALPGCEKLEPNPDGSFSAEMKMGIAMIKGTYRGRVEIMDAVPPERFRLKVEGQGSGGFLKGEGIFSLVQNGEETVIHYSGEAQVGGLMASVGQRLILGAAKQIVGQFFANFSKLVQSSNLG